MIKLLGRVPKTVCIAVSGGVDSMAALNFLSNNGKRKVIALYFNHDTDHGHEAECFVKEYCKEKSIPLVTGKVTRDIEKGESKEAYWREERYKFFESWYTEGSFSDDMTHLNLTHIWMRIPIVTCHHLDDAVETWVFTSLHGKSRLIPYKRGIFLRPFLMSRKEDLFQWCTKNGVPYISDPSNDKTDYMRNFIRHELLPKALVVNPGLHKVVKKRVHKNFLNIIDTV